MQQADQIPLVLSRLLVCTLVASLALSDREHYLHYKFSHAQQDNSTIRTYGHPVVPNQHHATSLSVSATY